MRFFAGHYPILAPTLFHPVFHYYGRSSEPRVHDDNSAYQLEETRTGAMTRMRRTLLMEASEGEGLVEAEVLLKPNVVMEFFETFLTEAPPEVAEVTRNFVPAPAAEPLPERATKADGAGAKSEEKEKDKPAAPAPAKPKPSGVVVHNTEPVTQVRCKPDDKQLASWRSTASALLSADAIGAAKHSFHERASIAAASADCSTQPTLFVSIGAFRDRYLRFTIEQMFQHAACPEKLFIGVYQQNEDEDEDCMDGILLQQRGKQETRSGAASNASENAWNTEPILFDFDVLSHIRVTRVHARDARGSTDARYHAAQLRRNETMFLQVDGHMTVRPGWDAGMWWEHQRASLQLGPELKAVLTSPPFHWYRNRQLLLSRHYGKAWEHEDIQAMYRTRVEETLNATGVTTRTQMFSNASRECEMFFEENVDPFVRKFSGVRVGDESLPIILHSLYQREKSALEPASPSSTVVNDHATEESQGDYQYEEHPLLCYGHWYAPSSVVDVAPFDPDAHVLHFGEEIYHYIRMFQGGYRALYPRVAWIYHIAERAGEPGPHFNPDWHRRVNRRFARSMHLSSQPGSRLTHKVDRDVADEFYRVYFEQRLPRFNRTDLHPCDDCTDSATAVAAGETAALQWVHRDMLLESVPDLSAEEQQDLLALHEEEEHGLPVLPQVQWDPPRTTLFPSGPGTSTFVTALFDLGRAELDPSKGFARPFGRYVDALIKLLWTPAPMVLFLPRALHEHVWNHPLRHDGNTHIVPIELDDLNTTFPHWDTVQMLRQRESWRAQADWLRHSPQSTLAGYNPIVMSKVFWLAEAARQNNFGTSHFFWIDAGITQTVAHEWIVGHQSASHTPVKTRAQLKLDDSMPTLSTSLAAECGPSRLLFVSFPYEGSAEIHGFPTAHLAYAAQVDPTMVNFVVRGGMFGGSGTVVLRRLLPAYSQALSDTLSHGHLGTEESVLTVLALRADMADDITRASIEGNGLMAPFFERMHTEGPSMAKAMYLAKRGVQTQRAVLVVITGACDLFVAPPVQATAEQLAEWQMLQAVVTALADTHDIVLVTSAPATPDADGADIPASSTFGAAVARLPLSRWAAFQSESAINHVDRVILLGAAVTFLLEHEMPLYAPVYLWMTSDTAAYGGVCAAPEGAQAAAKAALNPARVLQLALPSVARIVVSDTAQFSTASWPGSKLSVVPATAAAAAASAYRAGTEAVRAQHVKHWESLWL